MFAYTHVPTSLEAFPAFFGVSVAEKMLHTIRAAVLAARVCRYAPYSPHVCTETNHLFYMCMQVYTILTTCVYKCALSVPLSSLRAGVGSRGQSLGSRV